MSSKASGFSIVRKLAVLAGVPVAGALLLAWLIVSDAQREAQAAAALGSVEDLAKLAGQISDTIEQTQRERVLLAWQAGKEASPERKQELAAQFERTDAALGQLESFLAARDQSKLPPRLARDLAAAREALAKLPEQRKEASGEDADVVKLLAFYGTANSNLTNAIAALMQLSNHGELLRTISLLVSVLQLKEVASQEHAVLTNVFENQEFAPGAYKELVKLVTEYDGYERVLLATADDDFKARYEKALEGESSEQTAEMRKAGLETMDDDFGVEPERWYKHQGTVIGQLRTLEQGLNQSVKQIALERIASAQRALTTGTSISGAILLFSILLAWLIGRGVSRSVASLTTAAAKVQQDKDFSVRAVKVSSDELGMLTEAFNEMLTGIQARDNELEHHRQNLEHLVEERTAELSARNEAMRVVLDNVREGLVGISREGVLETETSAAFADWFGAPPPNTHLAKHLEAISPDFAALTELGWDAVVEDMLPWDLSLEQMPASLTVGDRHYRLEYRGVERDQELTGALLVVSDITEQLAHERREAAQQEMLQVFSRLNEDRHGFLEFLGEARRLVDDTRVREGKSPGEMMRTVHTIKGNCNIFGVTSVGVVAHELESFLVENEVMPEDEEFEALYAAWGDFERRISGMVAGNDNVIEVSEAELDAIVAHIDKGASKDALRARVVSLRHEPAKKRLQRLGDRARALSKRLGKGDINVVIDADDVRLADEAWTNLFSSLVHAVRNTVDHGFEGPDERKAANKPPQPQLTLRFKATATDYRLELTDDGRGIAWDKLGEKATTLGLPFKTKADKVSALFADGVSSREQVTDQSGRGVGMAALRDAIEKMGGKIEVDSTEGKGTVLRFVVPQSKTKATRFVA